MNSYRFPLVRINFQPLIIMIAVLSMNDENKMTALAAALAKAKSEQNIQAALAIYHPEAEMIAPSFGAVAKGAREIEHQLYLFFCLFPDYSVELEQHAVNGNVMLATGTVTATLNVQGKSCAPIALPVFIEFHFRENRISKEVFNLDLGMVCRESGVTPEQLASAVGTYHALKKNNDK